MSRSSTPLTLSAARSLLPGEVLTDDVITGLQLFGNLYSKTWKLYYVTRQGVKRRPKLGNFPAIGIDDARKMARELLMQVGIGKDPSAEQKADRTAATVADLCREYLDKYARPRKRSWWRDEQRINKYIMPVLGPVLVKNVTLDDIELLITSIEARDPRFFRDGKPETWRGATAPIMANRIRSLLNKMFDLAEVRFKMRDRGTNPVRGAIRYTEKKRRRYGKPEELRAIAAALADEQAEHPQEVAAIWVLFLSGGRVNEIAMARIEQLRGDCLVLSEHKTMEKSDGDRLIILPKVALDILATLPPDPNGYLFGGRRLSWAWYRVCRRAGVVGLQLRDARRTFASVGLSDGLSLDQMGGLLGHGSAQTTKGYAFLMEEPAIRAANQTANRMADLMRLPARPPLLEAPRHNEPIEQSSQDLALPSRS